MDKQIQQWQLSVTGPHGDSGLKSDGPAASLTAAACNLYRVVLRRLEKQLSRQTHREISQLLEYLQLWADGYGASSKELDEILGKSKRLRQTTIHHLATICRLLSDQLVPIIEGKPDEELLKLSTEAKDTAEVASYAIRDSKNDDSDTDSDEDGELPPTRASLEDVFQDLKTEIQCLQALGPRFEEPVLDRKSNYGSSSSHTNEWDPAEYLASRIRHRYPDGDPDVIALLGKKNWDRMLILQSSRDKSHLEVETDTAPLEGAKGIRGSEYDSGLGSSVARTASYAETVVSYHGAKGGSIRIPPLPTEAKTGKPFPCAACGGRVVARTSSLWKQHILQDLQPYICLEKACKFAQVPLPDKKTWVRHLELDHDFDKRWKKAICPFCTKTLGASKQAAVSHLSSHLEENSLTILPTNSGLDDQDPEEVSSIGSGTTSSPLFGPESPLFQEPTNHSQSASVGGPQRRNAFVDDTSVELMAAEVPRKQPGRTPKSIATSMTEKDAGSSAIVPDDAVVHQVQSSAEPMPLVSADTRVRGGDNGSVSEYVKTIRRLVRKFTAPAQSASTVAGAGSWQRPRPKEEARDELDPAAFSKNIGGEAHLEEVTKTSEAAERLSIPHPAAPLEKTYDEDWVKIIDEAERRRIGNRIAQRNYRRKLKQRLLELEQRAADHTEASLADVSLDQMHASAEPLPLDHDPAPLKDGNNGLGSSTSLGEGWSEDWMNNDGATEMAPGGYQTASHNWRGKRSLGSRENKAVLCRNVLIYGHCRYEDQGCVFRHGQKEDDTQRAAGTSGHAEPSAEGVLAPGQGHASPEPLPSAARMHETETFPEQLEQSSTPAEPEEESMPPQIPVEVDEWFNEASDLNGGRHAF